ncbi:MAG TPA: J domain-containing protein [Polyangia bacterium]|jgi:DnaJ-domain-containing protein 1
MSLTRRFLNLAKANLNALLDRVGDVEDEPSLGSMTDEELEAELMRRKARRERDEEMRRAREEAERAARARQGTAGTAAPGGSAGPARTGAGPTRPAGGGSTRVRAGVDPKRLAQLYAQLEVPVGADLAEIKAAYRRLMRKYHPDNYGTDPKKAALATELTQKLSQAYRELEAILRGAPPRKRM